MDLFSVFTSPESYTVRTEGGDPVGTLSQGFVDRLVDDVSSFLLGGRAWAVVQIRHEDRRVVVKPARRGELPTWMGSTPQFLGFEVCQKMLTVLRSNASYGYCNSAATAVLEEYRDTAAMLVERGNSVEVNSEEVRWWTFAGGRLNSTLRYALQATGVQGKVSFDNLMLRIHGEGVRRSSFLKAVGRLEEKDFWEDDDVWSRVASSFPNYRLSKFQKLMPPWVEREVVGSYLLDVRGAWEWLTGEEAGDSLRRVPDGVRRINPGDNRTRGPARPDPQAPRLRANMDLVVWVETREAFDEMCFDLREQELVGLDVETGRWDNLCLVQMATPQTTYLVDVLEVGDLDGLGPILADERIVKVIHYAPFERRVLGNYGFKVEGVVDTCAVSREVRGGREKGRHTLQAVCLRELGGFLDKSQQASDWTRRPLTKEQVEYAALDAEILLRLFPGKPLRGKKTRQG
jgi:ATP-dependent Lhr-like helicase